MLEVRLLGTFEVKHNKKLLSISSRPAQSLFAYLILSAGTAHRREKLAGLLWPDSLEETARDNLRHALWRLRKVLPASRKPTTEYLLADDLSIAFNASVEYWLDTAELEKLSESASAEEMIAVLSNYQGELLPGFYDEWVTLEREHLQSLFEHHMARLMSLLQEEKRWLDILDWGERWIKLGQKPEPAYRALMSAHAAKGDMSKVAATYERCVKSLKEFGVEPSEQTRALYERLKTGKEILETGPVLLETEGRKQSLKTNLLSTRSLPSGTVNFMFTDIEGSTKLWQQFPATMPAAVTRHHEILNQAITSHNGHVFQIIGDAFCAAFATALDGLEAALEAQRALRHEAWGDIGAIRVRMALHTGSAEVHAEEWTPSDYVSGITLSRAARLLSAGHGGQILLSLPTADLVREQLPDQIALRDMGTYRLKDLVQPQQIFQILAPDLPQDFPALKTLDALPNNLPLYLTSFIGRERELKDIKDWLGNTRLLTLTGAGGSGKTRLALQVAAGVIDNFEKGTWLVELAPIADASLVPNALMNTFQLREEAGRAPLDALIDFLRAKTVLLVLDNCEHLIEACARLAHELLTKCPNLKILATSREALGIAGEVTYQVPTLALPDPNHLPPLESLTQYDAVQLFIERATALQSNFTVTNATAPAVTQICYRLDGIPLAIELAAARIRLFSPQEIASRLDDRFRLLIGGSRMATPRQQTLRGAIEWSYSLLAEPERILFRRLAVFAGGWTFDAAEAVCAGDGLDELGILDWMAQLVNKSLVLTDTQGWETRYDMLETIREYARERLAETDEEVHSRSQHLKYFLQLSEQAESALRGRTQMEWLARLKDERDNLRAALSWAMKTNDIETGLLIAGRLRFFWTRWDFLEGERWLAEFINKSESHDYPIARAKALCAYGHVLWIIQKFSEARNVAEECLTLFRACGDQQGEIDGLLLMENVLRYLGTIERTTERKAEFAQEALALAKSLGDRWRQAQALAALGWDHRDYSRARAYWEEAVALFREAGDAILLSDFLSNLGNLELLNGDFESAQEKLDEATEINRQRNNQVVTAHFFESKGRIAILNGDFEKGRSFLEEEMTMSKESGDRIMYLWARTHLGHLALRQGNLSEARDIFSETTRGFFQGKNDIGIIFNLEGVAGLYAAAHKHKQAAILIGWSDAAREKIGDRRPPIEQDDVDRDIAACLAKIGEVAFAKAYEEGKAMSFDEAVEFALTETKQ